MELHSYKACLLLTFYVCFFSVGKHELYTNNLYIYSINWTLMTENTKGHFHPNLYELILWIVLIFLWIHLIKASDEKYVKWSIYWSYTLVRLQKCQKSQLCATKATFTFIYKGNVEVALHPLYLNAIYSSDCKIANSSEMISTTSQSVWLVFKLKLSVTLRKVQVSCCSDVFQISQWFYY